MLLARIARRLCGNDSDAADLVQDTYERALRAQDRCDERRNPRGWMVTILHHLFIDRRRKMRRSARTVAVDDLDLAVPEPDASPPWSSVTLQQVDSALATVGAEFRRVYDLHVRGWTYDEIAAELKIPKGTVGTRLLRARGKLKDALMSDLAGDRLVRRGRRRRRSGQGRAIAADAVTRCCTSRACSTAPRS
ncbi:MAG TPA: RNA polymerase sigma factor [Kofleriaceae bacterium]